jgi:O-methyltransferase
MFVTGDIAAADGKDVRISRTELLEVLCSAYQGAAADLAAEIKRLRARAISLEAELQAYLSGDTPFTTLEQHFTRLQRDHAVLVEKAAGMETSLSQARAEIADLSSRNASLRRDHANVAEHARALEEHNCALTEAATDRASKLQEREASLTQALIEIATLAPENQRLRAEHAVFSQRAAELEAHNRLLTESATETALKLQERDAELTKALVEVATLSPDNQRLRAEHAVISLRAAEFEEHNQLLTESATEIARKLEQQDAELTQARTEVVNLARENERLEAEHAEIAQQAAELEQHNRLLTESATETARKLQERETELTGMRVQLATIKPEKERLEAEHAEITRQAAELQEHNRLLTESATATARKLQERETELTGMHVQLATIKPEKERLSAEHADISRHIRELERHNRSLTESATAAASKLQAREETDYQVIMAQQQLLAGLRDAEPRFHELYEKCRPYTMTSVERLYALYKSVEYVVAANLPGDFAEAGVWRGGSCMLIAETLLALGNDSRRIFLFDTFAGHVPPDADKDVDLWGNRAVDEWRRRAADGGQDAWAHASLDEVRANLARTGYPADRLVFVEGPIEETARDAKLADKLALLRLDTDWYASTKAGLEHLYPRLVSGGVLIVDDYGHYQGQRAAVDEYFKTAGPPILLNRIDYSGRLAVKR